MAKTDDEIRILAEPQMDPNVCNFLVDRQLYTGIVNCTSKEMAEGSPLLEKLFGLDGVSQVMVSNMTVSVAREGEEDWSSLGKKVGTAIREVIRSNEVLIDPAIKDKIPANDELRAKVQDIFDKQINPGLATHGGGVDLIDVQGTTIFVSLSGGCQGCAGAKYTLKAGIEQILREHIPEITGVVDVTDHAAGANPFY